MSEDEFYVQGCNITKHKPSNSYRIGIRRFRGLFGSTPQICSIIWARIAADNAHPAGSQPVHLLYALLLLKTYGTEEECKAMTGRDEKTFRKWAWMYIDLMARHVHSISFQSRMVNAAVGQTCFVSLDATDCPIQEPTPFSPAWYSHKLNGPGMKYEVGLSINGANIVWVNGGVPCGSWSDLKLAREVYVTMVNNGETTIADDTYKDGNYFIYPSAYPESVALQKQIMARHEKINSRLKQFSVLTQAFRHRIDLHPLCFHAIANVTQLMIANGEPLYAVN
jgi:hypothetical protein